jgi:hypothetical protein
LNTGQGKWPNQTVRMYACRLPPAIFLSRTSSCNRANSSWCFSYADLCEFFMVFFLRDLCEWWFSYAIWMRSQKNAAIDTLSPSARLYTVGDCMLRRSHYVRCSVVLFPCVCTTHVARDTSDLHPASLHPRTLRPPHVSSITKSNHLYAAFDHEDSSSHCRFVLFQACNVAPP